MILLDPRLRAMSLQMDTVPEALGMALKLEFATIPVYLYALYSIDPQTNPAVRAMLRSVVIEEMFHMAQVGNILIALGHPPAFDTPDTIPTYPGPLPGGVETQLTVQLMPFSDKLLQDTFLVIEEPKSPLLFPGTPPFQPTVPDDGMLTIGEFYQNINATIQQAGDAPFGTDSTMIQLTSHFGGTTLIQVRNAADAAKAINLIVEQGEGKTDTPASPRDLQGDYAHFYRFLELLAGQTLTPNPHAAPTDPPEQQFFFDPTQPIAFDPAGVRPLRTSPKAADYTPGSPERTACDAFNATYTGLLRTLHDAFNGQPGLLTGTFHTMDTLKAQALALTQIQIADGTYAGPTFEFAVAPAGGVLPIPQENPLPLTSYAQVQAHLTQVLTGNGQIDDTRTDSPHGAWWETLSYTEFITGTVPGVTDPGTGQPLPTLVKGDAAHSNLVLSLQGVGPLFDPAANKFGRMPADGPPFFTDAQIQPLSDWINAGCPDTP